MTFDSKFNNLILTLDAGLLHMTHPTKRFKTPHVSGFTLIELSVVMIIVGLLAGFGLPILSTITLKEKMLKTTAHQEEVAHALAAYVLMHYKLPCPAAPDGDGTAQPECHNYPQRCQGIIPYRTLGLPQKVARDGFNHWVTYKVTPELTKPMLALNGQQNIAVPAASRLPGLPGRPTFTQPSGGLLTHESNTFCLHRVPRVVVTVTDERGQAVLTPSPQDFIAFALISHGPEGAGAYTGQGVARFPVHRPLESGHSDDQLKVHAISYNPKHFTHIVFWVTRNILMAHYAKTPCLRSHENLNPSGS